MQLVDDDILLGQVTNAALILETLPETQPSCSTGNCTWLLFTSLGFCSNCQNIGRSLNGSAKYVDEYHGCDNPNGKHRAKNISECEISRGTTHTHSWK